MEYKGRTFQKKELKLRAEARLANLGKQMQSDDTEIQLEAMIAATLVETDLDVPYLESLTLKEFIELREIIRPKAQPAPVPELAAGEKVAEPTASATPEV